MKKRSFLPILVPCLFALSLASTPVAAQQLTKEQVEQIVADYIRDNPKAIIESVESFGRQQQEAEEQATLDKINQFRDWIYKNDDHAVMGNPKGDVTIVEFFDYNCGYCKQALGDMMTLLDKDKKLKMVMIELPILGDSSAAAGRWSLAAKRQNRYMEYHVALMKHKGPLNETVFKDYAKKLGLNVEQMEKDVKDPKINQILDDNLRMAMTFGMTGTPGFIIGDKVFRGYVGMEAFEGAVIEARQRKK